MFYRPWGSVDWVLSLSQPTQWHFVGAIGTEERSMCARNLLFSKGVINSEIFSEILDVDSQKYRAKNAHKLGLRRDEFVNNGGDIRSIRTHLLMDELYKINEFANEAEQAGESIILDVTSFPKRFFFPILKRLALSTRTRNLILTYTCPDKYPSDAPLYEDIEPWKCLPAFGGDGTKPAKWIVSIGFLVESLRREMKDIPGYQINILVPFPAPLDALRRTWKSIAELEESYDNTTQFEKFRVDTLDISAAFERICSIAGNPPSKISFAPFGPKTTSVAMCLYAIQRSDSAAVHYPQPTIYNPDYSIGIKNNDPQTAVNAYWVKHNGDFLYKI